MAEFREEAARRAERPTSYVAAAAIVLLWVAALAWLIWLGWKNCDGRTLLYISGRGLGPGDMKSSSTFQRPSGCFCQTVR